MTFAKMQLGVWVLLALAACSIREPMPEATTYMIEAPVSPGTEMAAATRVPGTLRVGRVRVAAAFAGTALVYRMDDVKLVSDPYSAFISDPGALLGDQMARWLEYAGPFRTVGQAESTQPADYVLEADVIDLYGDFRPGHSPAAVLAMRLTLIDLTGVRPRAVLQRSISKRVDIGRSTPAALVRGYGVALAGILTDLRAELEGVTGSPQHSSALTPRIR